MPKISTIWLLVLLGLATLFSVALYKSIHFKSATYQPVNFKQSSVDKQREAHTKVPVYVPEKFNFAGILPGLTKKQLDQHEALYHGYVNKRNEIARKLSTIDLSTASNISYSPYRALKVAQSFVMNGDILHRFYFGNLGKNGDIGPEMKKLIEESFGSLDNYKADLFAAGKSSRGWVITAYTLDNGLIENYVLDAHNQTVPVMVMPLLVLDVYEHAYMIDFGINRAKYLDTFWDNINWHVVEERIKKFVHPFKS